VVSTVAHLALSMEECQSSLRSRLARASLWSSRHVAEDRRMRDKRTTVAVLMRGAVAGGPDQFWAPPMPCMRSVIDGGFSMIWLKRTTVTVSSSVTSRP